MASFNGSVDVNVPIGKAFRLFSDFERFPSFMEGIEEVRRLDDDRLYWRAEIAGREEEWEALITEQRQDERIAWKSVSGAGNAGMVTFDKVEEGVTRVDLHLEYEPEGFVENVGAALGVVNNRIRGDLTRFKELAESTGSVADDWRAPPVADALHPGVGPSHTHPAPPLDPVGLNVDPFRPDRVPDPRVGGDATGDDRLAHEDRRLREHEAEDAAATQAGPGHGDRKS